jgi:hypothetical protein
MGDERRSRLARSVRAEKRSFRVQVSVGAGAVLGLGVLVTGVLGLDPVIVGAVVGPLAVLVFTVIGQRTTGSRNDDDLTTRSTGAGVNTVRLENFAFSHAPPTRRGWRRDVGDVSVHPERIEINGLDGNLIVYPPFAASLHDGKWMYWTMVKIDAQTDAGEPTTVYLVGMGGPLSKFSASPEDVRRRGNELVIEVDNAAASGSAPESRRDR